LAHVSRSPAPGCGLRSASVESLEDDDRLEMIAFSSSATRYNQQPIHATAAERRQGVRVDPGVDRGRGTQLIPAINQPLRPLRNDSASPRRFGLAQIDPRVFGRHQNSDSTFGTLSINRRAASLVM
jgi:hypothetical protein